MYCLAVVTRLTPPDSIVDGDNLAPKFYRRVVRAATASPVMRGPELSGVPSAPTRVETANFGTRPGENMAGRLADDSRGGSGCARERRRVSTPLRPNDSARHEQDVVPEKPVGGIVLQ